MEETQLQTPEMTLECSEDDSIRRHDVYLATITHPEARISQHQAFLIGMEFQKRKIHYMELPAALKY
jgi:hypothetical protein